MFQYSSLLQVSCLNFAMLFFVSLIFPCSFSVRHLSSLGLFTSGVTFRLTIAVDVDRSYYNVFRLHQAYVDKERMTTPEVKKRKTRKGKKMLIGSYTFAEGWLCH